jgi:hypothetical protein
MLLVLRGLADKPSLQFRQSGTSGRTVRHFIADGPPFHRGRSAVTIHLLYTILYNSYKIVYSSEKCEINFVGFLMMLRTY